MKIFFDFDGTLLDSSDRLYRLFCDLVLECKLSKDEYWDLKRNKINHQMILEKYFPNYSFNEFNDKWLKLIEEDYYLSLDKLYPQADVLLSKISKAADIYLLTARQSKNNLFKELERLSIKKYFSGIFVTENKTSKSEILASLNADKNCIVVGDTGKDINDAKNNNCISVAVSYGFLTKEKLEEYNPDFIIDKLSDFEVIFEDWRILNNG